jgi:hypothetical protein
VQHVYSPILCPPLDSSSSSAQSSEAFTQHSQTQLTCSWLAYFSSLCMVPAARLEADCLSSLGPAENLPLMRGLLEALPAPPVLLLRDAWLPLVGLLPANELSLGARLLGLLQVPPPLHSATLTAAPSSTLRVRVAKSREHLVSPTFSDAGLQAGKQATRNVSDQLCLLLLCTVSRAPLVQAS